MPTFYESLSTLAFNAANAQNSELVQRLWGKRVAERTAQGLPLHGNRLHRGVCKEMERLALLQCLRRQCQPHQPELLPLGWLQVLGGGL